MSLLPRIFSLMGSINFPVIEVREIDHNALYLLAEMLPLKVGLL